MQQQVKCPFCSYVYGSGLSGVLDIHTSLPCAAHPQAPSSLVCLWAGDQLVVTLLVTVHALLS
jgi:hypothetical protein